MVPVCSSVMLELVLAVHSYHVIAYPAFGQDCVIKLDANINGELKYKDFKYLILNTKQETLYMKPVTSPQKIIKSSARMSIVLLSFLNPH